MQYVQNCWIWGYIFQSTSWTFFWPCSHLYEWQRHHLIEFAWNIHGTRAMELELEDAEAAHLPMDSNWQKISNGQCCYTGKLHIPLSLLNEVKLNKKKKKASRENNDCMLNNNNAWSGWIICCDEEFFFFITVSVKMHGFWDTKTNISVWFFFLTALLFKHQEHVCTTISSNFKGTWLQA